MGKEAGRKLKGIAKIQVRLGYTGNRDKGLPEDRELLADSTGTGRREGRLLCWCERRGYFGIREEHTGNPLARSKEGGKGKEHT